MLLSLNGENITFTFKSLQYLFLCWQNKNQYMVVCKNGIWMCQMLKYLHPVLLFDLSEITFKWLVNEPTWKQITFQNNKKVFDVILKALSSVNFVGSVYESLYLKGAKLKYLVSRPV